MLAIHCYSIWYTNICYLLQIIDISLITVIVFTANLFVEVYLYILDNLEQLKIMVNLRKITSTGKLCLIEMQMPSLTALQRQVTDNLLKQLNNKSLREGCNILSPYTLRPFI